MIMWFLILTSCILWVGLLYFGSLDNNITVPYWKRGGGGKKASSVTYYYYQISAPHQSISPDHPIYCYDAYGELVYTIQPNDPHMNYGIGTYSVPGNVYNATVESIATATYDVYYSTDHVVIDYANACFYISEALISKPTSVTVWATFQYLTQFTASNDTGKIIDGDWNTQMQTMFYAEPPAGYEYAILDLGTIKDVQAIDLVCGFFRPTTSVKFDCEFNVTLKYSLDNVSYYDIGTDTNNFEMSSGSAKSFEEDKLGMDFQARYIKIILEKVGKINYSKSSIIVTNENYKQLIAAGLIHEEDKGHAKVGDTIILREGLYAVAVTEASAYSDIIVKSESFLIPTTRCVDEPSDPTVIEVADTTAFPEAGRAFIGLNSNWSFTYTGKTPTSFTGVEIPSSVSVYIDDYITESIETDTTLYDYNNLLPKLGDRMYKKDQSKTESLYTQEDLNYLSKEYLKEFVKNHGKIQVNAMFAPYLKMGQTVEVTDESNNINKVRYFVETINYSPNGVSATLARYPGD